MFEWKTLNKYCPNAHMSMFHSFGFAAAKIEILEKFSEVFLEKCTPNVRIEFKQ